LKLRENSRLGFFVGLVFLALIALLLSDLFPFSGLQLTDKESSIHHRPKMTFGNFISPEELKKNPKLLDNIRMGENIFYRTPHYAKQWVGNALSCTDCHVQGGTQLGMLSLLGVAKLYPAYDPRRETTIDLRDRIRSCFLRSENGKAPPNGDPSLEALHAYLTAISQGFSKEQAQVLDRETPIVAEQIIPIAGLNPQAGATIYSQKCSACHGEQGQGLNWAPPLWGQRSFNDGAGLAQVDVLAAFLKNVMPLSSPDSLSDAAAQEIAAFIDAQNRPAFSGKDEDFPGGKIPADAVYYPRLYPKNPLAEKLETTKGAP